MTFEPGGDAHIPNQIDASGKVRGIGRPPPGSPQAFNQAIIRVAVVNAVLLATVLVLVFVLELGDPQYRAWWLMAAVAPGALLMTATLLRYQRLRARYLQSPEARLEGNGVAAHSPSPATGIGGSFSFRVEESFTISGRGTVVTGQVSAGEVTAGQQVAITRGPATVARTTVSGIELNRRPAQAARAGENAGLVLPGVDRSEVHRGDVIVPAGAAAPQSF